MSDLQELNQRFSIGESLRFDEGHGGLTRARVATDAATAEIYLQGAHVTLWHPAAAAHPALFLSSKSSFAEGKPIRGGVPLVFPWFADRKGGLPGPAHGFARISEWQVVGAEMRPEGVAIDYELLPDTVSRGLGYDHFALHYSVVVGETLQLTLEVKNTGDAPLVFEEALHAYYAVSDVRQIEVTGLGGTDYLDRAEHETRKHQSGAAIRFTGETDQLHLNTTSTVTIADQHSQGGWQRRIVIEKQGSNSTVVWNPWIAKAARMPDFGDEEWPGMVCVEPANAAENAVTVKPGETHAMGMRARIEPL